MDFQQRLKKAIERGSRRRDEEKKEKQAQALSEEEVKRLHSKFRLELSDYIERCIHELADQFPGFQVENVVGEKGWGMAARRDDVGLTSGRKRDNFYSRLELVVRPLGKYGVLDLAAKGTIRNKEVYNRNHYQRLEEVDSDSFRELVDLWVLEYAELYAAKG